MEELLNNRKFSIKYKNDVRKIKKNIKNLEKQLFYAGVSFGKFSIFVL
jgi:hypothetical protein